MHSTLACDIYQLCIRMFQFLQSLCPSLTKGLSGRQRWQVVSVSLALQITVDLEIFVLFSRKNIFLVQDTHENFLFYVPRFSDLE